MSLAGILVLVFFVVIGHVQGTSAETLLGEVFDT